MDKVYDQSGYKVNLGKYMPEIERDDKEITTNP